MVGAPSYRRRCSRRHRHVRDDVAILGAHGDGKEYGPEKMRRFLKYELDSYLRGRGGELIEELPLLLVENQPYIHYRKGSLIMYALRGYIGEDVLNDAMKRYVEAVKFQEPPYTSG